MGSCKVHSNFRASVSYTFPPWLIRNTLISILIRTLNNEITTSLTLRNLVSPGAPVFHYIASNNVDGLRRLFTNRLANPNDIEGSYGTSALAVSK